MGLILVVELKVKTIGLFLDSNARLVEIVLEDELLEIKKGPFVGNFLAQLKGGPPVEIGLSLLAIWTLLRRDDKLNDELLLEDCGRHHLLLDRQLYFDPL